MTVGFLAVGLYLSIGAVIGAVAGYAGGAVDMLISRIIEIVLLFPAFFLGCFVFSKSIRGRAAAFAPNDSVRRWPTTSHSCAIALLFLIAWRKPR